MTSKLLKRPVILAILLLASWPAALAAGDWNDKEIRWLTYEQGIEAAKRDDRPICLVFYTQWCPHCVNYAGVFHDPRVVEQAKEFVMVRVDNDRNKELGAKFAPDGAYVPRTFFLSPAGALEPAIQAGLDKWKYFYDEKNPATLLSSMDKATRKFTASPDSKPQEKKPTLNSTP